MTPRCTATLVLAATLVTLAGAGSAAAEAPPRPLNPLCTVTSPVEEANPGQRAACSTGVSAEANASVGGFPGYCIQVYPYSEVCDGAQVGAEARADGALTGHACVEADPGGRACEPPLARPQALGLP